MLSFLYLLSSLMSCHASVCYHSSMLSLLSLLYLLLLLSGWTGPEENGGQEDPRVCVHLHREPWRYRGGEEGQSQVLQQGRGRHQGTPPPSPCPTTGTQLVHCCFRTPATTTTLTYPQPPPGPTPTTTR